ncbi:dihydrolipoyl dehydrogenase [Propionibacterium sp.]|uniref:dihydrolipoyl dehydrogenase n=1 Tax=Propionibacterium sp. TaxID=1977903 RepID=UPI0039EB338C
MSAHFDVVVLGAGPGGYVAAIRAAQLGLKTAVVEKKWWGGVCLNVGCIPTKSLLRNADIVHTLDTEADLFGINGEFSYDYAKAFKRSRQVSEKMVKGVHYLMKKNKITEIDGWGAFKDAKTLQVEADDGSTQEVSFDNAIIAVGATVKLLPGTKKSANVLTYEELILSEELPSSIIVGGSGAIGTEFSFVLASYGVDVTIVEFLDRMVPNEDADVSKELTSAYKKLGVKLLTSTAVKSVVDNGHGVDVTVTPAKGGEEQVLHADKMLQALGFAPRTEGYGLENTGVELTERGAIAIGDDCSTNVPGIYAIGDCTAKMMLAHVAEAMGMVAAETIAGEDPDPVNYTTIPRATYCQPQVASFGLSEQQAKDAGYQVKVSKFPFSANGKAVGMGAPGGFVKIVADARYDEILGAHMIGEGVTELLPELVLAQKWDLTTAEVAAAVHAHPTLSEAIKEAAEGIEGHMTNL